MQHILSYHRLLKLICITSACMSGALHAQISDYVFVSDLITYEQAGNGASLTPGADCVDDINYALVTLPFMFSYCGTNYNQVGISENGYVRFGAVSGTWYEHVLAQQPATIACFAANLKGCATSRDISYVTLGSAPNRIFVIQWRNWGLAPDGANEINCQLRLFESTNRIQIVYGNMAGITAASITVGVSGTVPGDVQTRSTTDDWSLTTAGGDSSVCVYNALVKPNEGLIFQWQPNTSAAAMEFSTDTGDFLPVIAGEMTSMFALPGCYDDDSSPLIALPFVFNYHGVDMTSLGVHANGYIKLGGTAYTYYTNVLGAQTETIALFNHDLYGCTTFRDISYGVTGVAPNRTYIVQFTNWGFFNSGQNEFSAQIRLQESNNSVWMVYGNCPGTASKNVYVGMNGATTSDFHVRSTTTNWAATSKALSTTATCKFNSTVKPLNGQAFIFSPPENCTDIPVSGVIIASDTVICQGGEISLSLSGYSTGTGITYQWQIAEAPDYMYVDVDGATDTILQRSVSADTYFKCVVTCDLLGESSTTDPLHIEVLPLPMANILPDSTISLCASDPVALAVTGEDLVSFQWLRDGISIAGATDDAFVPTATGVYSVWVADSVCAGFSEPIQIFINQEPAEVFASAATDTACAEAGVSLSAGISGGSEVIFVEDWSAVDLVSTGWTVEGGCENWKVDDAYTPAGASAPTAYFDWIPSMNDYNCALISPIIDGTAFTEIYLDYLLLLDNYSISTLEQFKVEYKTIGDSVWTLLELFDNSIDDSLFQFERVDQLLIGCGQSRFQVRFTAFGESSFNIDAWGLDDIVLKGIGTYSYAWTSDPAGFVSAEQNPVATAPGAGIYQYTVTVTNILSNCSASASTQPVVFTESFVYYADADADGFGDADSTTAACIPPIGFVPDNTDCNDAINTVFPGAEEICDGLDNDCDGMTDNFLEAIITPAGPVSICKGENVILNASTGAGYTYQWKKNGANIGGATSSSYSVTKSGNYSVLISVAPFCSQLSEAVSVTVNSTPASVITNLDGTTDLCVDPSIRLRASNGTGYTWQWIKGGSPIAGATGILYSATTTGNYRVTVTSTVSGCSKTSSPVTIVDNCFAGTTLDSNEGILVFPNPSSGHFTVQLHAADLTDTSAEILVYTMMGDLYASYTASITDHAMSASLQLENSAAAGIYLIKVVTPEREYHAMVDIAR